MYLVSYWTFDLLSGFVYCEISHSFFFSVVWCLIQYCMTGSIYNCIEVSLIWFPITFKDDWIYSWIHSRKNGLIPDHMASHYRMTSEDLNWMMFMLPVVTITLVTLKCWVSIFSFVCRKGHESKKQYWRYAGVKHIVNFYRSFLKRSKYFSYCFKHQKSKEDS